MNAEIIIGNSGKWVVTSPYAVLDVEYTCTAINTFESLEGLGVSVLTQVYQSVGLEKAIYDDAKANGVRLITLSSANDGIVIVPEDHIETIPRYETVPYSHVIIGVDIGLLWDDVNLDTIRDEINDLVTNHVGVNTTAMVRRIPVTEIIPKDKHEAIEQARRTNQRFDTTAVAKLAAETERNATLTNHVTFLEQIIAERYSE